MQLIEGQLIHRRYRLDARLAQGGMGEVWKGYDIQLGRPVAIKALRGDLGVTQEAKLLRLRAEAHNSANLAHPNIAALFEYYEHDGIGFLVMEYVPSKSLADLFHEQNGPMEPTRLLPILIQTARGLFVAHSHGVIHRDVKPANIMVSDSGEVKITDFGVSYSTNQEQITQDGMVVGTAQYISRSRRRASMPRLNPISIRLASSPTRACAGIVRSRVPRQSTSPQHMSTIRFRRCQTPSTCSCVNSSCRCCPKTRLTVRRTR